MLCVDLVDIHTVMLCSVIFILLHHRYRHYGLFSVGRGTPYKMYVIQSHGHLEVTGSTRSQTGRKQAMSVLLLTVFSTAALATIIVQVHVYLRSSSWETRIAAGQAVEAIAENVPTWQPVATQGACTFGSVVQCSVV